jgi:uncharacterized membrane protein
MSQIYTQYEDLKHDGKFYELSKVSKTKMVQYTIIGGCMFEVSVAIVDIFVSNSHYSFLQGS